MKKACSLVSLIAVLACAAAHSQPTATTMQRDIESFAVSALLEKFPQADVSVTVGAFNPVLETKACLNYSLSAPDHLNPGPLSIKVQCEDWSFYARTQAEIRVHAVVPKHLIERGKPISLSDLTQAWVPLQHVSQAFLTNPDEVVGKIAHRTVPIGRAIRARDLRTPFSVTRGDRVVIHAKLGAAHITTSGIAMQNGHIGDQINVKNERSERVIRPWVTAKGTVSTRPNAT